MANYTTASGQKALFHRSDMWNKAFNTLDPYYTSLEYFQWWRADVSETFNGDKFLALSRDGSIRGTVKVGTAVSAYAQVFLYYRPTGLLLAKTRCNSSGFFRFDGLDRNSNDYFAVSLVSPYNAQVFDKIVPLV